jgi:hypothetical protein
MRFAARLPLRRRVFRPPLMFASSSPRLGRNGLMVRKASDAGTLARSPYSPGPPSKCAKLRYNHNQTRCPMRSLPRHHLVPCNQKAVPGTTIFPSPGTWSTAGRNKLRVLQEPRPTRRAHASEKAPERMRGLFAVTRATTLVAATNATGYRLSIPVDLRNFHSAVAASIRAADVDRNARTVVMATPVVVMAILGGGRSGNSEQRQRCQSDKRSLHCVFSCGR